MDRVFENFIKETIIYILCAGGMLNEKNKIILQHFENTIILNSVFNRYWSQFFGIIEVMSILH
jgi:hypothetical protein